MSMRGSSSGEDTFRRTVLALCFVSLLIQIVVALLLYWKVSSNLALFEVYNQDTRERLVKIEATIQQEKRP